ncbi:MAG: serine/threonine protein kinase [Gammaproteobacteria bacterium]|nr:serine/threonine protein kinase [Gammaproteobacteria bacterium]MDH5486608.1 serine/threonine protein kinase [Gammaproteobacteria bacterium]
MNIDNALTEGYMLHHYRIAKTIGGGGFSIVYLARNTQTGKWVVIKEYLPDKQIARIDGETVESLSNQTTNNFNTGMKRFFDEAKALSKIRHPNIVRVTDFFRENNTVYMVMNYEDGKDLRWYIKRHNGRMSEKFIRTVFPPLLTGLRELHNHHMLHLDIKPANVYLRPGGSPLLLDFGAAQSAFVNERRALPHTLTRGFAPIEQHVRGHIGPWTDLYAVGATMWACLCGKAPPPATKRAEKDSYKPAVRQFSTYYSRQLLEAIDWCLQMDQFSRPQNVDALLDIFNREPSEQPAPKPETLIERLKHKFPW